MPSRPRTVPPTPAAGPPTSTIGGSVQPVVPEQPNDGTSEVSALPSRFATPDIVEPTIDPATFQRHMYSMMDLLTQNLVARDRPAAPQAPTPHEPREPRVKDPETFSGQRDLLNAFLTECEILFELQSSRFAFDRTRISYIISLLRGTPLLAVRPLLRQSPRPEILEDYELFIQYLRTNYGDSDERGTARRKLKALRQVGPASAYFAEFQQYIAILGWMDQDPIIDRALDGLKPYLKDEVARAGFEPATLTELIAFIVPLDNRLYERAQERRREEKDSPRDAQITPSAGMTRISPNIGNHVRGSTPVDTRRPTVAARRSTADTSRSPRPGVPNIPRGPLSDAEKQRRRDQNLCLYCGKPDHQMVNCPVAPPPRPSPSPSVQVKIEDGSRASQSSGNARASAK